MTLLVRRFYIEEFDENLHESTADIPTVDVCDNCIEDQAVFLYEEELIVPPEIFCDACGGFDDEE